MRTIVALILVLSVIANSQYCDTTPINDDVVNTGLISSNRVPSSPVIPVISQKIKMYKPAPMEEKPRTDCPHLWSHLANWHESTTWPSNRVPEALSDVVLPDGVAILVSACSWPSEGYGTVTIPKSSALIINDQDMELKFRNILVNGHLYAGSDTCRLRARINFQFLGGSVGPEIFTASGVSMGTKAIGVDGSGSIDIHGKQYHPTWTRLAYSAKSGEDILFLDDEVNWEAGQEIVVATTVYDDLEQFKTRKEHQNEVRTITGVSGRRVFLNETLLYDHYAGPEYQAEVGLLSRRIKFIGNPGKEYFGGHILVSGIGRFSGAEAYEMGQLNNMARYPFHFHLGGEQPNNYVRDCSMVNGQFRCMTIHGTNSTLVTRNVGFNSAGSCFYIEEGIEEKNEVSFNLAVHTRVLGRPSSGGFQEGETFVKDDDTLHPPDHSAAGFYITNAYNVFVGNAASGGWAGYAFPNHLGVYGPSLKRWPQNGYEKFNPSGRPTLRFQGNTAHSAGNTWGSGSCFYIGAMYTEPNGVPTYNSGRSTARDPKHDGKSAWMHFEDTKAFLCNRGLNHWGNRIIINSFETHDCSRSAVLFGESVITNALFNADSNNYANHKEWQTDGFSYYDTSVRIIISNVHFKNFYAPNVVAIRATTPFDVFKPEGINAISGVTLQNTPESNLVDPEIQDLSSSRYFNIIDWDGSFTGLGRKALIGTAMEDKTTPSQWWNFCKDNNLKSYQMYACPMDPDGVVEAAFVYITVPGVIENTRETGVNIRENDAHIGKMYLWGPNTTSDQYTIITKNPGVAGVTGVGGWYMDLGTNIRSQINIRPFTIPKHRSLMFAIGFPSGTTFSINQLSSGNPGTTFTASASYDQLFNSDGTKNYYFDNQHLYLKLVSKLSGDNYFAYNGIKITEQVGWYGFDIKITATCPNGNCYTNTKIPTFSQAVPFVDLGKITHVDTELPRPSIPELREGGYQIMLPNNIEAPTNPPEGWDWVNVVDYASNPQDTNGFYSNDIPVPNSALTSCGVEGIVVRQPLKGQSIVWRGKVTGNVQNIRVSFRYGFIDSWGYELASAKVNGKTIWSENHWGGSGEELCGRSGETWLLDYFREVSYTSSFYQNDIEIVFDAKLTDDPDWKSFSVSKLKVDVLTQTGSGSVSDCKWDNWSTWEPQDCPNDCSVTQTRSRQVASSEENGGLPCSGPSSTVRSCPCYPVDCVWGEWTEWPTECDSDFRKTRTRPYAVSPLNGGKPCIGESEQISSCGNTCGDGIINGLDECDDGNTLGSDGCSSDCKVEYGWECDKSKPNVCVATIPTSNYLNQALSNFPKLVPTKGTIVANINYGAKENCIIFVKIFDGSWKWYGQNKYGVGPGMGTARITVQTEVNPLPATIKLIVQMQPVTDFYKNLDSYQATFTQENIPTSSAILNTNEPGTPADTFTLSTTLLPLTIPQKGFVELNFPYTAPNHAILKVTLQNYGGNWQWHDASYTAVPRGTGIATLSLPYKDVGVGNTLASLNIQFFDENDYFDGKGSVVSYWPKDSKNPYFLVSGPLSAISVPVIDFTANDSQATNPTTQTSGFPVTEFVGGIAIGMVTVLIVVVIWKFGPKPDFSTTP